MTQAERLALRGDLIDFTAEPAFGDVHSPALRHRPDHWLLIEGGRIAAVQTEPPPAGWTRLEHRGRWILPGFIDCHVHSSQLDIVGAWGSQLLDWLEAHTFPAELRFADRAHAAAASAMFLDALLAVGTTAAVVFPTVHAASVDALFEAGMQRGMRLAAGKVLMDRHAPAALCDTDVAGAEAQCRALIERWHGKARCTYAVTPRFAPTSSDAQLAMAGRLLQAAPGLVMQTHVAENADEVRWVGELFPDARSYLDVYARHGLLDAPAVLAHGIWLDEADRALLRDRGAMIAFCPSSNLFLGSGLLRWRQAQSQGVAIGLASDVGGGTSLSMRRTMGDGYKVQALAGERATAWSLLHAATRASAQALGLGHEIGSLDVGALADICVWDRASGAAAARRQAVARDLHDQVFAWLTIASEADLVETWVAGVLRHRRKDDPCFDSN